MVKGLYTAYTGMINEQKRLDGNINLLAKDKVDDSIMRVLSKEIASELMEITFGDNG